MTNPCKFNSCLKRPLAGRPYVFDHMLADYRRAVNFIAEHPRSAMVACQGREDFEGTWQAAGEMDCCIDLLVIVFGVPKKRVQEDVESMYFARLEEAELLAGEREELA